MRFVALAVASCAFVSSLGVVDASPAAAKPLADGVVAAPGSRLIGGTVFPTLIPARPEARLATGWVALVEVTGEAGAVYDAYAAQARKAGLEVPFSDRACLALGQAEVSCDGSGSDGDRKITFGMRVCASCSPPVGAMTISYSAPKDATRGKRVVGDPPPSDQRFALALDATQRAAAVAARPTAGAPLAPSSELAVAPDAKVLASPDFGPCGLFWSTAVLRVPGDGQREFAAYARNLKGFGSEEFETADAERGRRLVREVRTEAVDVRLVDTPRGDVVIHIEECFE